MSKQRPPRDVANAEPVAIADFLGEEGFRTQDAQRAARAILESSGLTNPRKKNMATEKLPTARDVLAEFLVRACSPQCRTLAAKRDKRAVITSDSAHCDICGGSNNRRAAEAMIAACAKAGVRRLLVLGGTGTTHRELATLLAGSDIELRLIDGAEQQPNKKDAQADLEWAQFMVTWATTPLPHKVSISYRDERPRDLRAITVRRRSVEALCSEVTKSLAGRSRG